jgi:fatty-acyl-CoA synthase
LTRIGGVAALLDTRRVGQSLAACIDAAAPKHIIVAAEFALQLAGAEPYLKTNPQLWIHGENTTRLPCIDGEIEALSGAPLEASERREVTIADPALCIYMAGIAGLPKPAVIDHERLMRTVFGFAGILNAQPSDRMFDCLPMYRLLGGVAAIGPLLVRGGSVAIRERFSARDFWHDLIRTECTLLQYVGDIPRALLRAPPLSAPPGHQLRLCCGVGLRHEIWREFKTRFAIPHILEFYASTDGNVTLFNFEEKDGSLGRLPWFVRRRFPTAVVRFDVEKEAPVRDSRGFCMRCRPGEAGEAIGRTAKGWLRRAGRSNGSPDDGADNERRILRNVFKRGDAWLRTGDLMSQDADGYFYFVDRIGDTYRWKGENVSTTEVELALRAFPGVEDALVYGVAVPHRDGRAGMAALVARPGIDLAALHAHLAKRLPSYARPIFLRLRWKAGRPVSLRLRKADLVADGCDPGRTADELYCSELQGRSFARLDAALHARILAGEAAL